MHLFILDENLQQKDSNLFNFIEYWKDHYYNYTDISDSIYYYILDSLKNNKDIARAINLLGAWKTNAIGYNPKTGNLAFICPCGAKYYFNKLWKTGTRSGFDVWISLPEKFNEHKSSLNNAAQLISTLSNLTYNGPKSSHTKFRLIYSITYLHFLAPEHFPILDIFVYRAIRYIFSSLRPNIPYEISNDIKTPIAYKEQYKTQFDQIKKDYNSLTRNIDKALWAFGHFISKKKACCEK